LRYAIGYFNMHHYSFDFPRIAWVSIGIEEYHYILSTTVEFFRCDLVVISNIGSHLY